MIANQCLQEIHGDINLKISTLTAKQFQLNQFYCKQKQSQSQSGNHVTRTNDDHLCTKNQLHCNVI